jgi:hypothetical protein
MERTSRDRTRRRPAIVVKLANDWHGAHCVCAVPPGMTPPNGSKVRVVVPENTLQEFWFLAPKLVAA